MFLSTLGQCTPTVQAEKLVSGCNAAIHLSIENLEVVPSQATGTLCCCDQYMLLRWHFNSEGVQQMPPY